MQILAGGLYYSPLLACKEVGEAGQLGEATDGEAEATQLSLLCAWAPDAADARSAHQGR